MKSIAEADIIQYVADMITCSPADVQHEFDMSIDAARMRLKRMSEKKLLDRERVGNRSYYTIRNMNVHLVVGAKAMLNRIIKYMVNTNHAKLTLVPETKGGSNTGGGYTYQWRVLLEIMQEMSQDQLYGSVYDKPTPSERRGPPPNKETVIRP